MKATSFLKQSSINNWLKIKCGDIVKNTPPRVNFETCILILELRNCIRFDYVSFSKCLIYLGRLENDA